MNWKQDNTITKAMGSECYDTADLANLFAELGKEGYCGLSLGLIIDVIRGRLEEIHDPDALWQDCSIHLGQECYQTVDRETNEVTYRDCEFTR